MYVVVFWRYEWYRHIHSEWSTAPYTFSITSNSSWGNHEHDSDHVELYERWSGSITVKVTDANLCNTSATINLTQPASSVSVGQDGRCSVVVFWRYEWYRHIHSSGGTAPYTFSITSNSAGATTSTTATHVELTNGE